MCVDCVLASPRIAQAGPSGRTPSPRWFCHNWLSEQALLDIGQLPHADPSRHPLSVCAAIKGLSPLAFCLCPAAFHPPVSRCGLPCSFSTMASMESPFSLSPPLIAGSGAPPSPRAASHPVELASSPAEHRCASSASVSYHPTIAHPPHRELVLLAMSGGCTASHRCS
jgi:hypothetical protein